MAFASCQIVASYGRRSLERKSLITAYPSPYLNGVFGSIHITYASNQRIISANNVTVVWQDQALQQPLLYGNM